MDNRIALNPSICHGQPVITGTRVPVSRILSGLAGGMNYQELMDEYDIVREDIQAVLDYAADVLEHEHVYALST